MFFRPQHWNPGTPVALSAQCQIEGFSGYTRELLESFCAKNQNAAGTVSTIRGVLTLPEYFPLDHQEEAYQIQLEETAITLYGGSRRGLLYAAVTLLQMENHEGLFTGVLQDAPDCAFRGYRAYLPGRHSFADFYRMVDTLVYYKYNYLSLEIGGAMEYKRHPEINEAWQAFAKETHRYSGRTHEIQNGFGWSKNSIHTDNGEGDLLTQDEVRQLIRYARERELTVYPETPLLSHSDYLCLAHPEIRERAEDPYPDTYCPNHPGTYPLVFDVLEEVLEVFSPELVNIGHDEYYSICLCPRCKGKKPEEVFASDVIKIHDFLKERGVRTAMWGDKLLPVVTPARTYGGAGEDRIGSRGQHVLIPPTFGCQRLLPKDILMINWYHSFGLQYDFVYHTHGYDMIYGNMAAERLQYWRERRRFGAKGGCCSNWGSNAPEYMQRNCQYLHLLFGAFALWSPSYQNNEQPEVLQKAFEEAFHLHYGNLSRTPYLIVTHTTPLQIPYKVFYDGVFIEDSVYHMGNYQVTYADGSQVLLEVKYGSNISAQELPCALGSNQEGFNPASLDESALGEVAYSTLPFRKEGKTWYRTAYRDPFPEKAVRSVNYLPDRPEPVEVLSFERTGP